MLLNNTVGHGQPEAGPAADAFGSEKWIVDFRDVVRGTVPSLQPVEDGARSLLATLAIAEAATEGRRIDLRERYAAL